MKKESILAGIVGLLVGVLMTGFAAGQAVNNKHAGMMNMMGMEKQMHEQNASGHNDMSMSSMTEQLKKKTGDDFDKAFLEMMISHHVGAVEMAELIPDRAKHEEIKKLGSVIIDAQTKEIADMKQWQKDWGYSASEMNHKMHGNR
jgi:uncharacterized protein (DUF305 family)